AGLGWGAVSAFQAQTSEHAEPSAFSMLLTLACFIAAVVVLWSVTPRGIRFTPPGPALVPDTHPLLFQEVRHIATATRQKMPDRIYLLNDVNAFVARHGGVFGLGGQRVLAIGLPLLCALDMQQLRSVLGHEFGHLSGGDASLLPWVYRARLAMISVVGNL